MLIVLNSNRSSKENSHCPGVQLGKFHIRWHIYGGTVDPGLRLRGTDDLEMNEAQRLSCQAGAACAKGERKGGQGR